MPSSSPSASSSPASFVPASDAFASSSLLARLFALEPDDPRFARRLVALRDTEKGLEPVTAEAFLRRAAAWRATFARANFGESPSADRPRRLFVLTDDTLEGAALLFGAWGAGVETMLGSDALPETLKRLRAGGLLEAGDGLALDAARGSRSTRPGISLPLRSPRRTHGARRLARCSPCFRFYPKSAISPRFLRAGAREMRNGSRSAWNNSFGRSKGWIGRFGRCPRWRRRLTKGVPLQYFPPSRISTSTGFSFDCCGPSSPS